MHRPPAENGSRSYKTERNVTVRCGGALLILPCVAAAQAPNAIPPILITPDTVDTSIGTLKFKDGAPSAETAQKIYDTLNYTRGLDAFLNSYGGASAYAIRKGFLSVGAEDNTVVFLSICRIRCF
jgi:hypothetical protein